MELQSELACRDDGRNLDQFIDLAIRIDNLIRSRRPTRSFPVLSPVPSTSYESEPMQIGFTRLSPEERAPLPPETLPLLWTVWSHESRMSHSSSPE